MALNNFRFATLLILLIASLSAIMFASSSSTSQQPRFPLRFVTVNSLFDDFYQKYVKTQTIYPKAQRIAATIECLQSQEPFVSADIINFQEFDVLLIAPLKQIGFHLCLSDNPRANSSGNLLNSAFVATAVRRSTFKVLESLSILLEPNGSKALLLTKVQLVSSAVASTPVLIGNAHVPWSQSKEAFAPYFKTMIDIMKSCKNIASIFSGDFNALPSVFEASMSDSDKSVIVNAIPDVTFSYLAQNNFAAVIDHVWYSSTSGYLKRKTAGNKEEDVEMKVDEGKEEKDENEPSASSNEYLVKQLVNAKRLGIAPSIMLPSDPTELIRHGTDTKNGGADFHNYFSDHATIGVDFELLCSDSDSSCSSSAAPTTSSSAPASVSVGELMKVALAVAQEHLGQFVPVVQKEPLSK